MSGYFSIYRPLNLLFIALAQVLCAYFLFFRADWSTLLSEGVVWLITGTVSTAAFGYWINDFYDYDRDIINKPATKALHKISPVIVYLHFFIFLLLVILSGYQLGLSFLVIFLFSFIFLWFYSFMLKDIALLGNVLIAILSFLSVYMVGMLFRETERFPLLHFATLAGLLTLCREIVKDAEDMEGDEQTGAKTLPMLLGLTACNKLLHVILLISISFLSISVYFQKAYFSGTLLYLYWAYYLLFVIIPLYIAAVSLRIATDKSDYSRYSGMLKYVLFTGIISILFF